MRFTGKKERFRLIWLKGCCQDIDQPWLKTVEKRLLRKILPNQPFQPSLMTVTKVDKPKQPKTVFSPIEQKKKEQNITIKKQPDQCNIIDPNST